MSSCSSNSNRIEFANILRGICALLVVFQHYFHDFWIYKNALFNFLSIDVTRTPSFATFIDNLHFNFGHYAVYIFFIISGFVIPISIERYNRKEFIIQRIFRIYPTYIVCSIISYTALYLYNTYLGVAFKYDEIEILTSILLLRDVFLYENVIDIISWTLQIEIKFYISTLIFYKWFREHNLKKLLYTIITIFIVGLACMYFQKYITNNYEYFIDKASAYNAYEALNTINYYCKFTCILSMGCCFYFFYKEKISRNTMFTVNLCLLIFFAVLSGIKLKFFNLSSFEIFNLFSVIQAVVAFGVFAILLIRKINKSKASSSSHYYSSSNAYSDSSSDSSLNASYGSNNDIQEKSGFNSMYRYNIQEKRPILFKIFNQLANASYSLYLVHGVVGLIIIDSFNSILIGILCAITYTSIMTPLIYKFVEKPSIKIGKVLSSRSFW